MAWAATGGPCSSEAGRTPNPFGYTSGSPIVTSDGTRAGTALVWVTFSTSHLRRCASCARTTPSPIPRAR